MTLADDTRTVSEESAVLKAVTILVSAEPRIAVMLESAVLKATTALATPELA
jgi:hypothetical protein